MATRRESENAQPAVENVHPRLLNAPVGAAQEDAAGLGLRGGGGGDGGEDGLGGTGGAGLGGGGLGLGGGDGGEGGLGSDGGGLGGDGGPVERPLPLLQVSEAMFTFAQYSLLLSWMARTCMPATGTVQEKP